MKIDEFVERLEQEWGMEPSKKIEDVAGSVADLQD
jgi:uncharacterized protein (DUF2267 family)